MSQHFLLSRVSLKSSTLASRIVLFALLFCFDSQKAHAQVAEVVGRHAQSITVRIDGATLGSGVLLKRQGDRYTVVTAWHVVSDQRPGEELLITTPDNTSHSVIIGSLRRIPNVDLALLTFSSKKNYTLAKIGDVRAVSMGSPIYVAGYPLPTSAVDYRLLRFLKGDVIANSSLPIKNGYQLLYSNPTLPGMSGGSVLDSSGLLVGIHGQAETDYHMTEQEGIAIKTGTNQAVPISYVQQVEKKKVVIAAKPVAKTALLTVDDYLVKARSLLGVKSKENEVIELASKAIEQKSNYAAYYYRAYAKDDLGDRVGALQDLDSALAIDAGKQNAYYFRGILKYKNGDKNGSISDFDQAITIDPQFSQAYSNRGVVYQSMGQTKIALSDYSRAIAINGRNADAYRNRGSVRGRIGDYGGALDDFSKAVELNPNDSYALAGRGLVLVLTGSRSRGCEDLSRARTMGMGEAENLQRQHCLKQ